MPKNHYEILGLTRDATAEQIKKAYRKLARKYHPDVSKEPDAEARMQELNVAYDTLSDETKKLNMTLNSIIHKAHTNSTPIQALAVLKRHFGMPKVDNRHMIFQGLKTYLGVLVQVLEDQTININAKIAHAIKAKTNMRV
jgi:hypothetical protein